MNAIDVSRQSPTQLNLTCGPDRLDYHFDIPRWAVTGQLGRDWPDTGRPALWTPARLGLTFPSFLYNKIRPDLTKCPSDSRPYLSHAFFVYYLVF